MSTARRIPRTAPATTCSGVCPTYSFSFSWRKTPSKFRIFSKKTLFNSFACFPVSRLTPIASYNYDLRENKADGNSKLPTPYFIPDAVVSAQTVAEWELGIPPEPKIRSGLKDLLITISITVFKNCATVHPSTALISIWFPRNSFHIVMFSSFMSVFPNHFSIRSASHIIPDTFRQTSSRRSPLPSPGQRSYSIPASYRSNMLRIADNIQHLMGIVVREGESCSCSLELIVRPYPYPLSRLSRGRSAPFRSGAP